MRLGESVEILSKWNEPQIHITVSLDAIQLNISLENFLIALVQELPTIDLDSFVATVKEKMESTRFVFTKSSQDDLVDKAVRESIKTLQEKESQCLVVRDKEALDMLCRKATKTVIETVKTVAARVV